MTDIVIYKLQKWANGIQYHNAARAFEQKANEYIKEYGRQEFNVMAGIADDIERAKRMWLLSIIELFVAYLIGIYIGHLMR